jgi:1-pyrroline-5-carboxylate dehydrogenase
MATMEAPPRLQVRLHEGPFRNEPPVDFSREENARKMRAAIEKVRGQLGREYDLIIGGKHVKTAEKIKSLNPAKPSQIVGIHQKAGKEHVEPAMAAALKAFESWRQSSFEERASLLFRVADLLRERKYEFMAWLVFEVSKNWAEADGDIAETIDFCELYAREALRLSKAEPVVQLPGERDHLFYIPLGVGAVIPPWNFPCAIMAGMTLASIVCGNTVILKPSSDSPTIAAKFIELLEEAGIPEGVVNFCPGAGGSFGDAVHRVHGFARSWPAHKQERGYTGAGPDLDQAHHPRDGRQGRHHRRRRHRSRCCCRRRRTGCVRIPGAEVLRVLASDCG